MTVSANVGEPPSKWSEPREPGAFAFPGRWIGGTSMVAGPVLLLAGVLLRFPAPFFFPAQLEAYARAPARIGAAYALFAAGNLFLWPAVLVLAQVIGVRCPRWALWGGALTMCGLFARTFSAGVDHLALELVRVQGVELATKAVADSYGAFHIFLIVALAKIPGWLALAAGSYKSRVLPLWRAAALALMAALMGGTLKGSTPTSVVATLGLCATLLPLGVQLLRGDGPAVPRYAEAGVD